MILLAGVGRERATRADATSEGTARRATMADAGRVC